MGIVYAGVGTYALMYPAKESYYQLWVPISFFVYLGTIVFYLYNYVVDKNENK